MGAPPAWLVNAVGFAAGLCSIVSFLPQIVKIWRNKHAKDVSLNMFAVTAAGFSLWIGYGVFIGSWPLTLANGASLSLTLIIIALRLRYGAGA
ncbi:MAG: SemiSWEET family sugar transporter [Hyphomonadaceae bacterium]